MGQGSLKNISGTYITHLGMEGIPLPFSEQLPIMIWLTKLIRN